VGRSFDILLEERERMIEVNDNDHSFHGAENWLLLRLMRGTKRLNPFFRLREASEVLSFSLGLSLVAFHG